MCSLVRITLFQLLFDICERNVYVQWTQNSELTDCATNLNVSRQENIVHLVYRVSHPYNYSLVSYKSKYIKQSIPKMCVYFHNSCTGSVTMYVSFYDTTAWTLAAPSTTWESTTTINERRFTRTHTCT